MSRYQLRRLALKRRHVCTRCGSAPAKPGCAQCPDCLAVKSAKRAVAADPLAEARRRVRIERKRNLIREALARLGGRD